MSANITFSGLSSGIDTASIIDQLMSLERRPLDTLNQKNLEISRQRTEFTSLRSKVSALQSAIQKLTDARIGGNFDIFKQKTTTSSADTKVVANATNSAIENTFKVRVSNLATATSARSTAVVGQVSTGTTALNLVSGGVMSSGNFSVFVNGTRHDIAVNKDTDTMQDVLNRVTAVLPGGSASMDAAGKISLGFTSGATVSIGSSSDTSNFAQVTTLTTGAITPGAGMDTLMSQYGTNTTLTSGTLTNNNARLTTAVTAGTVTIAGDSFTIDSTTTLDSLIQAVNAKGKVLMSFDRNQNVISLVSKATGNQAISLGAAADTSNFLSAANLVVGGNSLSSQTLGQNANFEVDGIAYQSTSNTGVSATVHGMTGVTLDLKNPTGTDEITLTVGVDKDAIKTLVNDFVTKLNDVLKTIGDKTNSESGILKNDQSLIRLRSSLRGAMSSSVSGLSDFSTLSQLGISTGAPTASPGQTPASAFQLNESTFFAALAKNPDSLKALLIGDDTHTGIVESLKESFVDASLDPEFGLFSSRDKSISAQLKNNNDSITRLNRRLELREKSLRAQFTAMEQAITRLRQQQSSLG